MKTESKHTPGPWKVDGAGQLLPFAIFGGPGSLTPVAEADDKANARLIAAAPDLLKAAKLALSGTRELEQEDAVHPVVKRFRAALRAAIAKAEGNL
ncbi:MAG: hypothetical protein KGL39_59555 [Patescibacteria group bacterium]|nr:hypothetical protein [Patescibacteria group bacterium]